MNPAELLFWVIAGLTVGSAAGVAFSRSIINSSLSLLGALLGVGGLYVFLSADFLAVAQILIYVGGVLVLILFAVMLTSRIQDARASNAPAGGVAAAVCTLLLALVVVPVAVLGPFRTGQEQAAGATASALGRLLLHEYLLPFELASLLLLGALIGAVALARRDDPW